MAKIPQKPPEGFQPEDRIPGFLRQAKNANLSTPDRFGSIYEFAGLTEAGARFWFAVDGWSLEESRLLLCGVDPRKVGALSSEFVNALLWPIHEPECKRMLRRAGEMCVLNFPAKPVDVITWADGKLPMTVELLHARASVAGLKSDEGLPAPAFEVAESASRGAEPEPTKDRAQWSLKPIERAPGYRWPLYQVLKAAHIAGQPRPKARDVLETWKLKPPPDVQVMPDGVKYNDGLGNPKEADLKAIGQSIKGLTK